MRFCKLFSVIFAVFALGICFAASSSAARMYGDINGDGKITSDDARIALRTSVGLEKLSSADLKAADVDGTPGVSSSDARLILRVSVKLEELDPAAVSCKPSSISEIADFYKAAVKRVKNGDAGYTKKEWQTVYNVKIGTPSINNAVTGIIGNIITREDDAKEQINEKGSDQAKNRFPDFTLTDYSQIASATCDERDDSYNIRIVMVDEDTPKKTDSVLGQVTNSVLYWEDIDDALKNDSTVNKIITAYNDVHVVYRGFTINAMLSTDGEFLLLEHFSDIDVHIGSAKILITTIRNKSMQFSTYAEYNSFEY